VVRASVSCRTDESLLTGESEPVGKQEGDRLLSGSFGRAGSGGYQATAVGAAAYARQLAAEARRFTLVALGAGGGPSTGSCATSRGRSLPVAALLLISQLQRP